MSTFVKTLVYVIIVVLAYCEEHDVPIMLHVKRFMFVTNWSFAAWAQRRALKSYDSYVTEAELTRG